MNLHKIFVSLTWRLAAVDRRNTTSKIGVLLLCLLKAWIPSELWKKKLLDSRKVDVHGYRNFTVPLNDA